MDKSTKNELTETGILNLMDERFKKKYVLYEHLHSSYNSLVEKVVNFMETNDNIFDENRVGDMIYRNRYKIENTIIRPPTSDKNDKLKFPQDARDNNDTYGIQFISRVIQIMEVYDLNLKTIVRTEEIGRVERHQTGENFPVMNRSKYCSLEQGKEYRDKDCEMDPGGYFIVNGAEKIVLSFEKMIENKPLVFTKKTPDSLIYKVKINSRSSNPNIMMQGIEITLEKNGDMIIKAPIFNEVSVFVLMRALGLETDKEIVSYIMYGNEDIEMLNVLKTAIELSKQSNIKQILNKEDAYTILTNKIRVIKKYSDKDRKLQYEEKKEHLNALLRNAFMPHIDSDKYADPLKAKGYFLGYMINKLIRCYLGKILPDDRDSFTNKRIDLPGDLIFDLYKQYYKKLINDCSKFFKKRNQNHEKPINIIGQFKPSNIEQAIKSAMMTGNWGKKKGVAQMYPRLTFLQSLSFLRRVDAPSSDSTTMKLTGPRHYHPSQVGFLCPIESPEHANIGLVKHMSLSASITTGTVEQGMIVYNILKENKNFIHLDNISILSISKQTKIFINGEWLGQCDNALELYTELKSLKQNGIILRTTGITYDIPNKEIKIYTDSGRLYRPLLKVENNELILKDSMIQTVINDKNYNGMNKWDALLEKYPQAIEYIDMEESYFSLIAQNIENVYDMKERSKLVFKDNDKPITNRYDSSLIMNYTHCEIHPTMIIGIIAGNIPFSNHNQGPRNIFQYAQGRQAMGFHNTHYRDRLDISYILYNTQKPLISTKISKYTHTDVLPCGENAVVMIGCYSGYNQDDSIIFNQSSIERGLFRSSSYKKWGSKIEKNQSTSQDDKFMKPDPSKLTGTRHVNYDKLNDKGYVPEETEVNNGDVIIGKVSPIQPVAGSNKCYKDSSEIYKSLESAIIDRVFDGLQDNEGYDIIKIRTRSERVPKVGDKFCCYTEDTEVLTSNGWVLIKDLTMNHKVASLMEDESLEYHNPIALQNFDHDDELYKINSNHVDLIVTKNHHMYIGNKEGKNFKRKMASEIYNKLISYKKNVDIFEPENPIGNVFTIKGIEKSINEEDVKNNEESMKSDKEKPTILYLDILIDYSENHSSEDETINNKLKFINTKLLNYKKTNKIEKSDTKTINKYVKEIFNLECDVNKMKFRPIVKRESNIITELEYPEYYDRKISNTYDKSMDEYKIENKKYDFSEDINIDMNSWLIFFGIWMAEGCAVDSGKYVSIATHKPRVKYALNVALKNIDINCCKYKEHDKDTQNNCWRIFDKRIYNFFKDLSVGAVNKQLPEWVWNLTRDQCKVLIFGMWLGDGCEDVSVNKESGTSTSLKKYVTSSSKLADDFQRLCLHAGFCTNKRIKCEEGNVGLGKNKIIVASTTSYILSIITSQMTPSVNKNVKSIEDQAMFNDLEDTRPKIVDKYKIDNLTKEELSKIEENKKIKNYSDKYISWSDYYKGLELKKYRTRQIVESNNKIYEESCKLFDDENSSSDNKISKNYILDINKVNSKKSKVDINNSKNEKLSKNDLEKQKYEIKRASVNKLIQEETNYINSLTVSNTGKVYCCTVPGKGVIYVRRNGLAVWCGQSRHGQKGTIGLTLHRSDMPFTKEGITPDLIVNPQAIPSRMTIGQLVECLLGKVASLKGTEADGTPFTRLDLEKLKDELEKLGYDRNCNEYMYNGMTGEQLKVPIFIGPTFYQRLKHLTADKMHSRARGPTTMLTHQPPEGRSKEGGLRNGEMERDVLISYGMSKFLKERLLDASDIHSCYVCGKCGLFAKRVIQKTSSSNPKNNDTYECIGCKNKTDNKKVIIPYAFKLLIQELLSMNIAPRIKYKNINNDTEYINSMKDI